MELQILGVLWKQGPSTVREVHQILTEQRETGYSTTLKMMQVMLEKGLVRRNDKVRPQLYRATKSQKRTQVQMLDDFTRKAFHGSAMRMVMRMVSSGRLSAEELEEIQRLARKSEGEE